MALVTDEDTMARTEDSPLRSVSKRQNELEHEEKHIAVLEEIVDNRRRVVTKGPCFVLIGVTGGSHKVHNDRGGQPVGG